MHKESVIALFPNKDHHEVPGLSEPIGAMTERVIWMPYSPDTTERLTSEGYVPIDQFRGEEELTYGKKRSDESLWKLSDAIRLAAIDGDVAVINRADQEGKVIFRQVWVLPDGFADLA